MDRRPVSGRVQYSINAVDDAVSDKDVGDDDANAVNGCAELGDLEMVVYVNAEGVSGFDGGALEDSRDDVEVDDLFEQVGCCGVNSLGYGFEGGISGGEEGNVVQKVECCHEFEVHGGFGQGVEAV